MGDETTAYVPMGGESWRDPYPLYTALRDRHPVCLGHADYWVLSRFNDVWTAARDTATFSSDQGITFHNEKEQLALLPTIVMMDPPDHTRYRRLVSRGFTPRQVGELEPALRAFVRECVQDLRSDREVDFVSTLAQRVPCFVVAHYLGIDETDRARFARWTEAIVQAGATGYEDGTAGALIDLYSFFTEQIERRRREPGDDMISALLAADPQGVGLTAEEILGYMFVMIAGGNDTAIGLLAGGTELLAHHPDERNRLCVDPTRIPNAVEELLRLTSPVQGLCRVSTREVTLHGTILPTGSRVLLCYAAANRDPREFGNDAEQLNVSRTIQRHVALSSGPHFCLGAAAARLQARVVFEELLASCPNFSVDSARGTFSNGAFTRRHETLPFTAR
jgi:cytochrome P450